MTDIGWVGLADYALAYPEDELLSPPIFNRYSIDAVSRIMGRTFRRAEEVTDPETDEWGILEACEGELIHTLFSTSKIANSTGGGIMQSATTDGYSESYASYSGSGKTLTQQIDTQCNDIIEKYLKSSELTAWMLNFRAVE